METTNNIKFTANRKAKDGTQFKIDIRLNDECKNGQNDFSITGDMWEAGKTHTDRYSLGCGAIGDEIAANFPEFKIFNDLHLCDTKGAPMYAEANGFYHLKNSSKQVVMNYLRITSDEYRQLLIAEDKIYFTYLLDNVLQVPVRWAKEAEEAILKLEALTGLKFNDDSTRYQFTPLTAEVVTDIETKITSGYYFEPEIQKRKEQKVEEAKQAKYNELVVDRDKIIKNANNEFTIMSTVLLMGLPIDNLIYYTHTNTAVFNWQDSSYKTVLTEAEFNDFIARVDYSKLPDGITFKLGK